MSDTSLSRKYSTGLPFLDRRLDGGLPAGDILTIAAPPASQAQLLLRQLAVHHRTQYVSTTCPDESELRERLSRAAPGLSVTYAHPDDVLDDPEALADLVAPESFLVLDGIADLETADRDRYLAVLNALKSRLREADSVGVLRCPVTDQEPPQRRLTFERTDHIWRLEVRTESHDIRYRLLVVKARGSRALDSSLPLVITDSVRIDTSRNI